MPQYLNKNNLVNKNQLLDAFPSLISSHSPQISINPEQYQPHSSKQKSELCKQYVQTGFCLYEIDVNLHTEAMNCKAIGRQIRSTKRKRCQHFWQDNHCIFGNRCNYIHPNHWPTPFKESRQTDILISCISKQTKKSSRLLEMLNFGSDQ